MNDQKGQVLVEFALVLPLLLLLTFGIIDYGRVAFAKNCLGNAAAVAARTAAVTPSIFATSADLLAASASQSSSAPATAASNSLPPQSIDPALITYQQTVFDPTGISVTRAAQQGDLVQVTLTCNNFPMITPLNNFLAQLTDSTPQGSTFQQIVARAAMRYE